MSEPLDTQSQETSLLTQDKWVQQLVKFIRVHDLIKPGEKIVVAISGGLDSTCLAHLLVRASRMLEFNVEFAHVDHGTRGIASRSEGTWVKALADRLSVKSHLLKLAVPGIGKSQADLRADRRLLLTDLCEEQGAAKIATAHHGDDNAETFLMRAISGTGVGGLSAMSPQEGLWIKPLLWATRDELEAYVRRFRLAWVEDPSNAKGVYLRNRLRNEVFHTLEEIRPGAMKNMARLAERIAEESADIEGWLAPQFEGPTELLSRAFVEKFPEALQRRIFKLWLKRLGLEPDPALVETLIDGQEVVHSKGTFLRRSDMFVFLEEVDFGAQWAEPQPVEIGRRISVGSSTAWSFLASAPRRLSRLQLSVHLYFRPVDQVVHANQVKLAWDEMPWPLSIRKRCQDDSKRELDEILSRNKIPRPFWKNWPLLVSSEDPSKIIALVGLEPLKKYHLNGVGRCVSMESFYD